MTEQHDGPVAHPADNFIRIGDWPDPTPEMLDTLLFDTIWRVIKTWDINVPHAYSGYMGATGNHARAIYDAVTPLYTRPTPSSDMVEAPRPYPHATGVGMKYSEFYAFDDGSLTVRTGGFGDRDGTGWLCFPEDALEQEQDDETGKWYQVANLANSELIFLRDTLNAIFPSHMAAKDARIAYLEQRLEVVPGWSEDADGIACRNDTIALQDDKLAAKDAELAERDARIRVLEGELNQPLAMPIDIAEALVAIGEAEWGATEEKDAQGHAESVRNSVELTSAHFGQTGPQKMHGVYIKGDDTVICHTGTSPNSGQHARAITAAWNFMLDHARAALGSAKP